MLGGNHTCNWHWIHFKLPYHSTYDVMGHSDPTIPCLLWNFIPENQKQLADKFSGLA